MAINSNISSKELKEKLNSIYIQNLEFKKQYEELFIFKNVNPIEQKTPYVWYFNSIIEPFTIKIEQLFQGDELTTQIKESLFKIIRGIADQPLIFIDSKNKFRNDKDSDLKDCDISRLVKQKIRRYTEAEEIKRFKNFIKDVSIQINNDKKNTKRILKNIFILYDDLLNELIKSKTFNYIDSPIFKTFHKQLFIELETKYKVHFKNFNYPNFFLVQETIQQRNKTTSEKEIEEKVIDYSDTEKIERFVMLYEIGFLDYLNDKIPSSISEAKRGALISSFTGINAGTAKRYINDIKNDGKNNPLKKDNINSVRAKLTELGLNDIFNTKQ